MRIVQCCAGLAILAGLTMAGEADGQTLATRQIMEEKLARSQRILEALMMSDFETLQRESEALSEVIDEPGWTVLKTPEYRRYSSAFLNGLTDLIATARERDLDASMLHYNSVTMTCYQCHRYLKNARITDLVPIASTDGGGQKPPTRRPQPKEHGRRLRWIVTTVNYRAALQPSSDGVSKEK